MDDLEIKGSIPEPSRQAPDEQLIQRPGPLPMTVDDTQKDAVSAAAKLMVDAWKNEESRFNNLNTRALGILTASSVITAILGFFSKDLVTGSLEKNVTDVVLGSTAAAMVCLLRVAFVVVYKILKPGKRAIFGQNELTHNVRPDYLTSEDIALPVGGAWTQANVDFLTYREYGAVYTSLASRSAAKAAWLLKAYRWFFWGLLFAVLAFILVFVAKVT